ncbi:hypothetical protein GH983_23485 (plasmid) [Agrobacterium sp. MA01]|uniref:hypothetical protein n=1 Tax=Agrobacterium sp. MA01 TaxID=2664893 RepID=UPI00129ADF6F|nr:hypothetical protein [Agrobacterium sp. MA01]QGG93486.1 hypothetical protein GH983_23485 [Agrobacterium sp. MA01]
MFKTGSNLSSKSPERSQSFFRAVMADIAYADNPQAIQHQGFVGVPGAGIHTERATASQMT